MEEIIETINGYKFSIVNVRMVAEILNEYRESVGLPLSGLKCDCEEILRWCRMNNEDPVQKATELVSRQLVKTQRTEIKRGCGCGTIKI